MGKYNKIPGRVSFVFKSVQLKKNYTDKFRITFVRGKSRSMTDLVIPNANNELVFDYSFSCDSTFFVAKKKEVREKRLKVVLHRFVDTETQKIFGSLIINLAGFYQSEALELKEFEMNTGHSFPPILNFACKVNVKGRKKRSSKKNTDIDADSVPPLDLDGDKTHKNSHKNKRKRSSSEGDSLQISYGKKEEYYLDSSDSEPFVQTKKEEPAAKKEEPAAKKEEEKKPEITIQEVVERDVKFDDSGENINTQTKALSKVKNLFSSAAMPSFSKISKFKNEILFDVYAAMHKLMTEPIPLPIEESYMDSDTKTFPFPPSVFPIYSTFFKSKLFTVSNNITDDVYASTISMFYEKFPTAPLCEPCTIEQRFLTTLILLLLTNIHSAQFGYTPERTTDFYNHMLHFLNDYARQIISPTIESFENFVNIFSSARFDVDDLLNDFQTLYDEAVEAFPFVSSINKYVTNCVNNSLDAEMLNKILANPARFCFSKAAAWNSFLTACFSMKGLDFPLTRQCVTCLMMAVNIATDSSKEGEEDIRISVCPDLNPELVVYLLKNYKPDKMMEISINYRLIAQRLGVQDVVKYTPVKPQDMNDFQSAGDQIKIMNWNMCKPNQDLVKEFPFMAVSRNK